jgi:hypothetical protein
MILRKVWLTEVNQAIFRASPEVKTLPFSSLRPTLPFMAKKRDTVVLAVRVSIPFAEKVYARAGGKDQFAIWMHALLEAAVLGRAPGLGSLQTQGFQTGLRQGWAHANTIFREALGAAAVKLKK